MSGSRKWLTILVFLGSLLAMVLQAVIVTGAPAPLTFLGPVGTWGPQLQEAFKLFTARTGVPINVIAAASWDEENDKVLTMSAGGVPPDIIYGDDERIFGFAEQGLLQSLDTLIARDNVNLRVYPTPVVEGLRVRGSLYSMPTAVSIFGMFYNTDQFDKAGQRYLPTNWLGQELGWDEYVALLKKLTLDTNGDGTPEQYGVQAFGMGFNMIGLWGAQDIDEERTRYNGSDPQVIEALTQVASLSAVLKVGGGVFLSGTATMLPSQTWYLNSMRTAMGKGGFFNWKLGILPKGTARAAQSSFMSLGISVGSNNKENAWKLLRFLAYDVEGALLFTQAENRTPVLRETVRDYLQRWNQLAPGCNPQVFTDAVDVLWKWRLVSGYGGTQITAIFTPMWYKMRAGQISIREGIATITPQIQAILDDAKRHR